MKTKFWFFLDKQSMLIFKIIGYTQQVECENMQNSYMRQYLQLPVRFNIN